jgi:hypothetical protein
MSESRQSASGASRRAKAQNVGAAPGSRPTGGVGLDFGSLPIHSLGPERTTPVPTCSLEMMGSVKTQRVRMTDPEGVEALEGW